MKPTGYKPIDFPNKNGYRKLAQGIEDGEGLQALHEFIATHGHGGTRYSVYVPSPHEVDRKAKRRIAQGK